MKNTHLWVYFISRRVITLFYKVTEKHNRMTKTKLKQRAPNSVPIYRVKGNAKVAISEIIMMKAGHPAEPDRYEWICGSFFLRHRPGVSKTEIIELGGFQ